MKKGTRKEEPMKHVLELRTWKRREKGFAVVHRGRGELADGRGEPEKGRGRGWAVMARGNRSTPRKRKEGLQRDDRMSL